MISDEAQVTCSAVRRSVKMGSSARRFAEVPEAISQGATLEEVTANVAEALELALRWRRDKERRFPLVLM